MSDKERIPKTSDEIKCYKEFKQKEDVGWKMLGMSGNYCEMSKSPAVCKAMAAHMVGESHKQDIKERDNCYAKADEKIKIKAAEISKESSDNPSNVLKRAHDKIQHSKPNIVEPELP